jgi:hypothetical protein
MTPFCRMPAMLKSVMNEVACKPCKECTCFKKGHLPPRIRPSPEAPYKHTMLRKGNRRNYRRYREERTWGKSSWEYC